MAYYLSSISYYYKVFGLGGIHFTNVNNLCKDNHGITLVKCINILSERLSEESITLASAKQIIPGLNEPILEGGLGFSFTYNHHQSVALNQKHCDIYDAAQQIHCKSNCLAVSFDQFDKKDHLYLLFAFLISKKGVFSKGNFIPIKEELQKVLKLRKQEELFSEECKLIRMDETCMIVKRGKQLILCNFSETDITIEVKNAKQAEVLFNDKEQELNISENKVIVASKNCLLL